MSRASSWMRIGIVCCVIALASASAHASTVGLNLTWNSNGTGANSTDPTIMAAGDTTGVVSQANWNTVTMRDWYENPFSPTLGIDTTQEGHPTSGTLVDSTGAATGINVKSNVGLNWFNSTNSAPNSFSGTATEKMLYGFAESNGDNPTININNLSAAETYDVYAYFSVNDSNHGRTDTTLGGTTYHFTVPIGQASAFTQATNTTAGVYTQTGNYVLWSGVAPVSGTISFSFDGPDPSQGAGLAGIQIVSHPLPEPTTAAGLLIAGAAMAVRRSRGRRSAR
jgi:hypothetical protein